MRLFPALWIRGLLGFALVVSAAADDGKDSGWKLKIVPSAEEIAANPQLGQWAQILQPAGSLIGRGQTDVFAHGYYQPAHSTSPDGRYGVLIPRYGRLSNAPCFLVDLRTRELITAIDLPGYPAGYDAGSGFTWAANGSAFVMQLGHRDAGKWELNVLRGVSLGDGGLCRQFDLLRELEKRPSSEKRQGQWYAGECSFDKDGLAIVEVLEASAKGTGSKRKISWNSVQGTVVVLSGEGDQASNQAQGASPMKANEAPSSDGVIVVGQSIDDSFRLEWGPHNVRARPLEVVSVRDPKVRTELKGMADPVIPTTTPITTKGELLGFPICFISPDGQSIFVNQVIQVDPRTGEQARAGYLYRRVGEDGADQFKYELATREPLNVLAWRHFAKREKMSEPTGQDRSVYFYGWNDSSNRLLLFLKSPHNKAAAHNKAVGRLRSFECFGIALTGINEPLAFETHNDGPLFRINQTLRQRWKENSDAAEFFDLPPQAHQSFLASPDLPSELDKEADAELNVLYGRLMEKLPQSERDELRKEQRRWLQQRDLIAWVHAVQSWSPFPRGRLAEGRAAATALRSEQLSARLGPLVADDNSVIRDKSPDGRFGIRYHHDDGDLTQQFSTHRVELLDLMSQKVVLTLYDREEEGMGPVDISVLWAPDSVRVACRRSYKRIAETSVFERVEDGFEAFELPSLDEFYPKLGKWKERKFLSGDDAPEKWTDPNHLVIAREIVWLAESASGDTGPTITGNYRILLRFGKNRKATIEKVVSRKAESEE